MIFYQSKQGLNKKKVQFLVFIFIFFLVSPVLAGGENSSGPSLNDFMGKLVNSLILFGGLIFLMRKRLIEFFSRRSFDIGNDIRTREVEIQRKEEKINELIDRLRKLEEEITRNIARARESGRKEKSNIEKTGRDEIKQLIIEAQQEIDERVEISIEKMKVRIADSTIKYFKANIKKELDKTRQENIIENNIKIIGETIERENK